MHRFWATLASAESSFAPPRSGEHVWQERRLTFYSRKMHLKRKPTIHWWNMKHRIKYSWQWVTWLVLRGEKLNFFWHVKRWTMSRRYRWCNHLPGSRDFALQINSKIWWINCDGDEKIADKRNSAKLANNDRVLCVCRNPRMDSQIILQTSTRPLCIASHN